MVWPQASAIVLQSRIVFEASLQPHIADNVQCSKGMHTEWQSYICAGAGHICLCRSELSDWTGMVGPTWGVLLCIVLGAAAGQVNRSLSAYNLIYDALWSQVTTVCCLLCVCSQ